MSTAMFTHWKRNSSLHDTLREHLQSKEAFKVDQLIKRFVAFKYRMFSIKSIVMGIN